jgi:hypothetical protein
MQIIAAAAAGSRESEKNEFIIGGSERAGERGRGEPSYDNTSLALIIIALLWGV